MKNRAFSCRHYIGNFRFSQMIVHHMDLRFQKADIYLYLLECKDNLDARICSGDGLKLSLALSSDMFRVCSLDKIAGGRLPSRK